MLKKLIIAAFALATLATFAPPKAEAVDFGTNTSSTFTQFTNIANNATNTGITGTPLVIPPNTAVGVYLTTTGADAGTSNSFVQFNAVGKTGARTTTYPWGITNTGNGTNPVTSFTLLTNLSTVYSLSLEKVGSAQTNNVTFLVQFEWLK